MKIHKCIRLFVSLILIGFFMLYMNNDIGTYKSNIEKDARASHQIPDDCKVAKQTTDTMSAMLFYNEDFSDNSFSIYVNRDGLSFGYFFRGGGSIGSINDGIAELHIDGYNERAFISMNRKQVNKVEVDNGQVVEIIEIDSTKPFVFILPTNAGVVRIYDINNNLVTSTEEWL